MIVFSPSISQEKAAAMLVSYINHGTHFFEKYRDLDEVDLEAELLKDGYDVKGVVKKLSQNCFLDVPKFENKLINDWVIEKTPAVGLTHQYIKNGKTISETKIEHTNTQVQIAYEADFRRAFDHWRKAIVEDHADSLKICISSGFDALEHFLNSLAHAYLKDAEINLRDKLPRHC
jgi:hypothetical protein